jgi:hypothetical protein
MKLWAYPVADPMPPEIISATLLYEAEITVISVVLPASLVLAMLL